MIDIHCHILPGLDDGAKTDKIALKMARMAVKDGVKTIIATPHCYDGHFDCQQFNIPAECEKLNQLLLGNKIDLTVLPGAEIRLTPNLPELIAQNKVMTLADSGRYLLIELPNIFVVEGVSELFRSLNELGFQIILAHPERNPFLLSSPSALVQLLTERVQLQITAKSLLGGFGKDVQKMSIQLLQLPVRSYLASDGHNTSNRKPVIKKALKYARKWIDSDIAESLSTIYLP